MKAEFANYAVKPFLSENVPNDMGQYASALPQKITMLREVAAATPPVSRRPWSPKMAIKTKGRILFVDPTEFVSVHAEGNYVLLQRYSGSYLLRASITEMVNKLQRYGFIRIHRSMLVNRLFVEEMQSYPTGNYGLRVSGGKVYTVSRTYKQNLKALADCWLGTDTFANE